MTFSFESLRAPYSLLSELLLSLHRILHSFFALAFGFAFPGASCFVCSIFCICPMLPV